MDAKQQIEMQTRIIRNTEAINDQIKGLDEWEREMKLKEKQKLAAECEVSVVR